MNVPLLSKREIVFHKKFFVFITLSLFFVGFFISVYGALASHDTVSNHIVISPSNVVEVGQSVTVSWNCAGNARNSVLVQRSHSTTGTVERMRR